MDGYKLEQLLSWTLEDHLIDRYCFRSDGLVEISHSGKIGTYERDEAEQIIRRIIRRINTRFAHSES